MRSIFTLVLGFHFIAFAQTAQFELGVQEYDILNLETALIHFDAAYAELLAKNPDKTFKNRLAKILFYQAATYFFLNDLDTAKGKIEEALEHETVCSIEGLKLPSLLYDHCTHLLLEKKKQTQDSTLQNLLNIPEQITQNNLERALLKNHQTMKLQKTGAWLMISSSLPLGLGIGFGISSIFAKQDFGQNPNVHTQSTWRNYSIIADVSLVCGVAIATTGLILYLLNQKTS